METQKQTQKQKVKTLSASIAYFNPKDAYSDSILKEMTDTMRKENQETKLSVYKSIEKRIKSNLYIGVGMGVAGVAETVGSFIYAIRDHSNNDLALTWSMIGVASAIVGLRGRVLARRMKENLKMVTAVAGGQRQES